MKTIFCGSTECYSRVEMNVGVNDSVKTLWCFILFFICVCVCVCVKDKWWPNITGRGSTPGSEVALKYSAPDAAL